MGSDRRRADRCLDEFAEGSVVGAFEAAGALQEADRLFAEEARYVLKADAAQ